MAGICARCGKIIKVPFNKTTFEKSNGKLIKLHVDCKNDDWDKLEKAQLDKMKELKSQTESFIYFHLPTYYVSGLNPVKALCM